MPYPQRVLSVYELNEYVRRTLAGDPMLRGMQLRGEISNFKKYPSGHWYFSLKDDQARINCVMFRQNNFNVTQLPRDGESVVLTGSVSLYTKDGNYQFYVDFLRKDGVGLLYQQYLERKDKLEKEGLFDPARKKPIPLLPRRVGIITSVAGAVLHDIQTVADRRNSSIPLLLYPVKVQGDGAAAEMIQALKAMRNVENVDVIIIGRGGGSIEDLWAFNDEALARAIADSPIPIVSAVGHETDFTIADFVADMRAATPSQAAEICVADRKALLGQVLNAKNRMTNAVYTRLNEDEQRLRILLTRLRVNRPDVALMQKEQRLSALSERLHRQLDSAQNQLTAYMHFVAELKIRRRTAVDATLVKRREQLGNLGAKLYALSPSAVLERGYSLVYSNQHLVTDVKQLRPSDSIRLVMHNGQAHATIDAIEGEKS